MDSQPIRASRLAACNKLTLSLLMYIQVYGAPCKARNFNVVYIVYRPTFGNAESRLILFVAECFNTESMQKVILWHSRV
jgi:hypothetical protein